MTETKSRAPKDGAADPTATPVEGAPPTDKKQTGKKRRRKMWVIVIILAHLIGFVSALDAVMNTRTSQGAIAWAATLITFPWVAVPAYWVLGRSKFEGYVTARQANEGELQDIIRLAHEGTAEHHVSLDVARDAGSVRAAHGMADLPYLWANDLELLIDGQATFDSIMKGIDEAQDYILFQFFIIKDDELGREVKSHLVAKAKEGVRVYLLYDEVGSHSLPQRYIDELREAGAEMHDFHTRKGPGNRFQINFRNHRKIVVVDGKVAWVGGHNVGDEYMGRDPEFGNWRDTHVRIEGPAAIAVQLAFAQDWYWATEAVPELEWAATASPDSNVRMAVIPTGPADEVETAQLMFVGALNFAEDRIWIASPYFVPDEAVIAALQLAALRGVDVRILIPDKPDHLLVYLAAFSYFEEASRTGVKFYRYQDGFLHQKVMLIDDLVASVGTANFDNRSFRLNFEITGVVADVDFAAEVERMLLDDFARSRQMDATDLDERGYWFKLGVRLARLTSPIQ